MVFDVVLFDADTFGVPVANDWTSTDLDRFMKYLMSEASNYAETFQLANGWRPVIYRD